ncbi:MAG TPA: hypothetical protein VKB02_04900 [Pyrinomonadaceae bacterium]|nr:hypothetical protein [Pyrinomonadaceae bacterium]
MSDDRLVITEAGFLTEFLNQHTQRTERPFCFILGAGVSRASGISTGGEMANVWVWTTHCNRGRIGFVTKRLFRLQYLI